MPCVRSPACLRFQGTATPPPRRLPMDDRLISRLRQWLTPERGLPVLQIATPVLRASFRLYVLGIDALSRALLDADTRPAAYLRLRDRLFPNLLLRLDAGDVDELMHDGSELWLSEAASARWLAAARRLPENVGFSFLYSPFALLLDGACECAGWVVPASSRSPFPWPRLNASFGVRRVSLRLLPGPGNSEDPAATLRRAKA